MFNAYIGKKYLGHEIVAKAIKVGKNVNKKFINKNFYCYSPFSGGLLKKITLLLRIKLKIPINYGD